MAFVYSCSQVSWTESKPKLEKDAQRRATNPDLDPLDTEKLFREHVKMLQEVSEYIMLVVFYGILFCYIIACVLWLLTHTHTHPYTYIYMCVLFSGKCDTVALVCPTLNTRDHCGLTSVVRTSLEFS